MALVCDHADRAIRMRFNYYHPWMDEPEGRVPCECRKEKGLWNVNKPLDIPGKLVHRAYGGVDVAIIENQNGFYIISDRHGKPTALYIRRGSLRQAEREMYPEGYKNANPNEVAAPPPPRQTKETKPKRKAPKRKAPPKAPRKVLTNKRHIPPPPKPRRR